MILDQQQPKWLFSYSSRITDNSHVMAVVHKLGVRDRAAAVALLGADGDGAEHA